MYTQQQTHRQPWCSREVCTWMDGRHFYACEDQQLTNWWQECSRARANVQGCLTIFPNHQLNACVWQGDTNVMYCIYGTLIGAGHQAFCVKLWAYGGIFTIIGCEKELSLTLTSSLIHLLFLSQKRLLSYNMYNTLLVQSLRAKASFWSLLLLCEMGQ